MKDEFWMWDPIADIDPWTHVIEDDDGTLYINGKELTHREQSGDY